MEKLMKDLYGINHSNQLQERGLTLADYRVLLVVVEELNTKGTSVFFETNVAKYLMKFGIKFVNTNACHFKVIA